MFKVTYKIILISILFVSVSAFAGTFTPSPSSPGASYYTLSDIYNKISAGTSAPAHTFDPATTPSNTGITLTQLWDSIPPHRTLAPHDLDSGILPVGIYSTTTSLATVEPNLIAGNIATGTSIFGIVGTYVPAADLSNGLVAYYPLDSDTNDYSGNGYNMTNIAAIQTSGKVGGAYEFDGSNSHLILVSHVIIPSNNYNYTISAWIKTDVSTQLGQIYSQSGGDGFYQSHEMMFNNGKAGMQEYPASSASQFLLSNSTISTGTWHHIVAMSDSVNSYIYVDGALDASSPVLTYGGVEQIVRTGIGAAYPEGGYGYIFNGDIDEVAVYNRTLSPAEVSALYNSGSGRSLIGL